MRGKPFALAFIAIILLSFVYNPSFAQTKKTSTLTAIEDTHVWAADRNYGSWETLIVDVDSAYAYLKFDLSGLPANISLTSATLSLRTSASRAIHETPISVHYCSDSSWREMQITWNNKPSFDSRSLDSTKILEQGLEVPSISSSWYSWTVTATCQTALKNANKLLTLVLVGEKTFDSRYEETNYLPPF